jgi:ATP-dependent Clp protease adaptor protein ClpS
MDFVIVILMEAFNFSFQKASSITLQVHEQGKGIAGAYSKEIATMKVKKCNQIARLEGHPLLITMEAE